MNDRPVTLPKLPMADGYMQEAGPRQPLAWKRETVVAFGKTCFEAGEQSAATETKGDAYEQGYLDGMKERAAQTAQPTPSAQEERERFEALAHDEPFDFDLTYRSDDLSLPGPNGGYTSARTQLAWLVWQAALAAPSATRAEAQGESDTQLVERAVRNACGPAHEQKWAAVMDVFGFGSTRAKELCQRFGFNPDDGAETAKTDRPWFEPEASPQAAQPEAPAAREVGDE